MLLAGVSFLIYFARTPLNLIGQFMKPTRGFRVGYLIGQTATLDNLVLNLNQQFDIFTHGPKSKGECPTR
jgi:hypothetical protein